MNLFTSGCGPSIISCEYGDMAITFEFFTVRKRLQPPAHAGSSLADFSTLKMEAIRSSETSIHTRSTGATSQKTTFFIVTVVKTSDLKFI
jgi:hypothetical protein